MEVCPFTSKTNTALMGRWAQSRHRGGGGASAPAAVPAPVIESGDFSIGSTQPGWADVQIFWAFNPSPYPDATLEIWEGNGFSGVVYSLIATVPSTDDSYIQTLVADADDRANYKMRYVDGAVIGPWSNDFFVEIVF